MFQDNFNCRQMWGKLFLSLTQMAQKTIWVRDIKEKIVTTIQCLLLYIVDLIQRHLCIEHVQIIVSLNNAKRAKYKWTDTYYYFYLHEICMMVSFGMKLHYTLKSDPILYKKIIIFHAKMNLIRILDCSQYCNIMRHKCN